MIIRAPDISIQEGCGVDISKRGNITPSLKSGDEILEYARKRGARVISTEIVSSFALDIAPVP